MHISKDIDMEGFYKRFFHTLVVFCLKYMGDIEKSKNIAQDCFYKMLTSDFKVLSEENTKGFLYKTARNLCLSELRHQTVVDNFNELHKN